MTSRESEFVENFLFADWEPSLPADCPGQWRISRIQIYQWGTIAGYEDITVPRNGLLLTGPSGSGKSTLLDAISTVMTPDSRTNYNSAAATSTRGDSARNRMSYVRGAYARVAGDADETRNAYLRPEATRSGITLTFANGQGKVWSATRIFYIGSSSTDSQNLNSQFMSLAADVSLAHVMEQVTDSDYKRQLRKLYPAAVWSENSAKFQQILYRETGIGSEVASALLHKTIATKNVANLDQLMREYMLDDPITFQLAKHAVEQFHDLSAAHHDVLEASLQVEHLTPLRDKNTKLQAAEAELDHVTKLSGLLDVYHAQTETDFAAAELTETNQAIAITQAKADQLAQQLQAAEQRRQALQAKVDEIGGNQLARLEEQQKHAKVTQKTIERNLSFIAPGLKIAGCKPPATAAEHVAVNQAAQSEKERLQSRRDERFTELVTAEGQQKELAVQKAKLQAELTSLSSRQTAIPLRSLELRSRLAADLGLQAAAFPFVAELIEVTDKTWRGAIERLLRDYGLTMLVGEEHAQKVAQWVDDHRLTDSGGRGMKLVWEKVPARPEPIDHAPQSDSILQLLQLERTRFATWVQAALYTRFDYRRAESVQELNKYSFALTQAGQIRSKHRYVKDDRFSINDPRNWILGKDNTELIRALQKDLKQTEQDAAELAHQIELAKKYIKDAEDKQAALQDLLRMNWEQLDLPGITAQLAALAADLELLTAPTSDLGKAKKQLAEVLVLQEGLTAEEKTVQRRLGALEGRQTELQQIIARNTDMLAGRSVTGELLRELRRLCQPLPGQKSTALSLAADVAAGRKKLEDRSTAAINRKARLEGELKQIMQRFKDLWPDQSHELIPDLLGLDDYLYRLTTLENDGLPQFKDRFRQLLAQQSQRDLSDLVEEILTAPRKVQTKIQNVNVSLARTPYDSSRKSFLEIRTKTQRSPQATKFLQDVRRITDNQALVKTESDEEAEKRFKNIERLMLTLGKPGSEGDSWRRDVLDTRRHVTFIAVEKTKAEVEINRYESSKGLSGGQSQKLVTFSLAAALRYQLTDFNEGNMPRFGSIVLDEAFDKADMSFTRDSLEVFKTFGFQLILATPLKMISTLEPYVGGVALANLNQETNVTSFKFTPIKTKTKSLAGGNV